MLRQMDSRALKSQTYGTKLAAIEISLYLT